MSLLFYLPVCLSVAYSGNAAKAKRIKRGSAVAPAKQHNRSPHGGASIEVNTVLPVGASAEGEKRQSTHTIAATPMSALLAASETASDREAPSGLRQAFLVTSTSAAEESLAGEAMELLPHTSTAVEQEEGEYDEENPPLSAAVLTNPASNEEENRLI